jgi:branched-chain amino acid transport system ATP-binding protein
MRFARPISIHNMLLDARSLVVRYGHVQVLHGVDFCVDAGEIVALLGPNGAGKSSLVNALAGLVPIASGEVLLRGERIDRLPTYARSRRGLTLAMERRHLFPLMTVRENIWVGGWAHRKRPDAVSIDDALSLFPSLRDKLHRKAGKLSGGEQQMVALTRGLMSAPSVFIVDEPFLGLSPQAQHTIAAALVSLRERGLGVVVIEQNVAVALDLADRAYLLSSGQVAMAAPAKSPEIQGAVDYVYFGGQPVAERVGSRQ